MTLDERIARYLNKIPGAISGSDGHGQTFAVACALVNGFALDGDAALRHLTIYNAKCSPPRKPRELLHKVQQAEKTAHTRPRGHLLGTDANRRQEAVQGAPKPISVRLTAKVRQFGKTKTGFGTLGTLLFHPTDNACAHTHSIPGSDNSPSQASQIPHDPTTGRLTTTDPEIIKAALPFASEKEAWRAVEAAGFGDEPLIALAFDLFGPGCRVIQSGEAACV